MDAEVEKKDYTEENVARLTAPGKKQALLQNLYDKIKW